MVYLFFFLKLSHLATCWQLSSSSAQAELPNAVAQSLACSLEGAPNQLSHSAHP